MACPICKSHQFYVKDPSDEFETYEFEFRDGRIQFTEAPEDEDPAQLAEKNEIFCQSCAWHGKKSAIQ